MAVSKGPGLSEFHPHHAGGEVFPNNLQGNLRAIEGDLRAMEGDLRSLESDLLVMENDRRTALGNLRTTHGDLQEMPEWSLGSSGEGRKSLRRSRQFLADLNVI